MNSKSISFDLVNDIDKRFILDLPESSILQEVRLLGVKDAWDLKEVNFLSGNMIVDRITPLVIKPSETGTTILPMGKGHVKSKFVNTEVILIGANDMKGLTLTYSWTEGHGDRSPIPFTNHSYLKFVLTDPSRTFEDLPLNYITSHFYVKCPALKHLELCIYNQFSNHFLLKKENLEEGIHTFYVKEFKFCSGYPDLFRARVNLCYTLDDSVDLSDDLCLSLATLNHNRLVFGKYGAPLLEYQA